ncbi:hypothetical protein CC2G_006584 [Coprinopsis cinerea AmutBmut pab1-1]|nr:hypothetical protein CC2G_006584 [Coprinopsis cinerea AmutBmut pab1-1]
MYAHITSCTLILVSSAFLSVASAARVTSGPLPTPELADVLTATTTTTATSTITQSVPPCPPKTIYCPPFPYCGQDGSYTTTYTMIGTRCEACAACAPVSTTRGVPIPDPGTTLGAGCTPPPDQAIDYPSLVVCPSGQTTARTWALTTFWNTESKTRWCKLAGCFDYEPTATPVV